MLVEFNPLFTLCRSVVVLVGCLAAWWASNNAKSTYVMDVLVRKKAMTYDVSLIMCGIYSALVLPVALVAAGSMWMAEETAADVQALIAPAVVACIAAGVIPAIVSANGFFAFKQTGESAIDAAFYLTILSTFTIFFADGKY